MLSPVRLSNEYELDEISCDITVGEDVDHYGIQQDRKIASVRNSILGKSIDEQLHAFFNTSKVNKQIFFIDQNKVGIIFNPHSAAVNMGFFSLEEREVVLVTERVLPPVVKSRIIEKIPPKYFYTILGFGIINGQTTFQCFGLE